MILHLYMNTHLSEYVWMIERGEWHTNQQGYTFKKMTGTASLSEAILDSPHHVEEIVFNRANPRLAKVARPND